MRLHRQTLHGCLLNSLVLQIEDKDVPVLSHLVDIRVVNLRDEEDVSTSDKEDDDDEEEEEEEESPKVQALLSVLHLPLYIDTVVCCSILTLWHNIT